MPEQIRNAIEWALRQRIILDGETLVVTPDIPFTVVDKVREYFNINSIEYETFSFDDLVPFLQ